MRLVPSRHLELCRARSGVLVSSALRERVSKIGPNVFYQRENPTRVSWSGQSICITRGVIVLAALTTSDAV